MISKEEKEKERIETLENPLTPETIKESLLGSGVGKGDTDSDLVSGICPKGSYFCKSINECLPNDVICPK